MNSQSQQPTIYDHNFSIIILKCSIEDGVANAGDLLITEPVNFTISSITEKEDGYKIVITSKLENLKYISQHHTFTTQNKTKIKVISIISIIP